MTARRLNTPPCTFASALLAVLCTLYILPPHPPAHAQPTALHNAILKAQTHVTKAQTHAENSAEPSDRTPALSVPLSIFPGALVHGLGHFVEGESDTGWTLLAVEGVGVGMIGSSIVGLWFTGAAPRYSSPLTYLMVGGVGLFTSSFLADVYGVSTTGNATGSPLLIDPWLDVQLGYQNVYNPIFPHTHFVNTDVLARWSRFALRAHHIQGLDDPTRRTRLTAQYKLLGPRARTWSDSQDSLNPARDASHLTFEAGFVHHRFPTQGFSETTFEVSVLSRLDLDRLDSNLRGAFFDAHIGTAFGAYSYDGISSDATELLLGGVGFGFYLGHDPSEWGEASIYYNHRHDGFAAGATVPGLGSGNAGHAGIHIEKSINAPWGLSTRFEAGSAYVSTLSLVYRPGTQR